MTAPDAVIGLWHLGSVTSACMASLGRRVAGFDPDVARVTQLAAATPPVAEPDLVDTITASPRYRIRRINDQLFLARDSVVNDQERTA